jgi:phosphonate transport system permease protein
MRTDTPRKENAGRVGGMPWRLGVVLGALLAAAASLSALTPWGVGTVIGLAGLLAGASAAVVRARGMVVPMLVLAALSWSAERAQLRPWTLVENRHRASEYFLGKDLSEADVAELGEQAERIVSAQVRGQAERALIAGLGLAPGEIRPEGFAERVDTAAQGLREEMGPEGWAARVDRARARLERDRRGGFFPIHLEPRSLAVYLDATLETIAIALWGTVLAVVTALPAALAGSPKMLAVLAGRPGRVWRMARSIGVFCTRRGFDACRGFNEFVLALLFVAVIGLGPFAGVLALSVHTFGVLGKFFADAFDTARPGEIEGVTSTGASPAHVISYAVLPQVFPVVISQSLLRFESNVRSASVLGLVGAGGIGFLIDAKLKAYQFPEVATMMLLIIVLVCAIDFVCGRIVRRFV